MPGSHASTPDHSPTLVVGYDGSSEAGIALELAAHLAGPLGNVFVVICFDAPPAWQGLQSQRAAAAEADAHELVARLESGAVPALKNTRWEVELLAGPPAEAILRVAEVRDANEIFIGSRGRGRARSVLGSVSHDVLHRTDRPVRIITERAADRLTRVPTPTP